MAACGPFEMRPHLAVGVSGGPDSLALMLLLAEWVAARGGKLTALTVDHGLRLESATEAAQVARWAAQAGIDHCVLTWSAPKPQTGVQAAARRARYDLLTTWCQDHDVLHLAVAHQLDDQRETVAMRRARDATESAGSAGMSLITARQGVRLFRPLLPVPGETLKVYLRTRGQEWIDDPSNRQERFERIRWRQGSAGPLPAPADILAWGEARAVQEKAVADLLVRSVNIHTAGYALVDLAPWRQKDTGLLNRALGQLVAMIGGLDYLPARAAMSRTTQGLIAGAPLQSLGGALIGVWRGQGLICRESAAVMEEKLITRPAEFFWDRRWAVTVDAGAAGLRIGALMEAGLAEIGQSGRLRLKDRDIPAPARAALPALRDATGRLIAVPGIGFDPYGRGSSTHFHFRPYYSATSSGFTVAHGWPHTI